MGGKHRLIILLNLFGPVLAQARIGNPNEKPPESRTVYVPKPPLDRPFRGVRTPSALADAELLPETKPLIRDLPSTLDSARSEPRDFYISNSTGADSNDGATPQTPWRSTLNIGRTSFVPGDRIRFRAGETIHGGTVNISACGTIEGSLPKSRGDANLPIVFESYASADTSDPNARAIIDTGNERGFYAGCIGGITIRNLIFQGSRPSDGLQPSPNFSGPVGHNGILFWTPVVSTDVYRGLSIQNVDVSHYWHTGLLFSTRPIAGGDNSARFEDIDIGFSNFHDNLRSGVETWGTAERLDSFVGIRVHDSRAHHHPGTTRDNLDALTSGSGIVIGHASKVKIEDNVVYDNTTGCVTGCGFGIWTWRARGVLIQHNESYGNRASRLDGGGIDLDGGTDQALVQYNYTHDNGGAGYLACNFDGAMVGDLTFRFNISQNDGQVNPGGAAITILTQNWEASENPHAPRWSSGAISVYRNTFYSASRFRVIGSLDFNPVYDGVVGVFADNPRFIFFANNIFYADNDLPHMATFWRGGNAPLFFNNSYAGPHGTLITWDRRAYHSLGDWRAATGYTQETWSGYETGFAGDPLLVSAGNGVVADNPQAMRDPEGPLRSYRLLKTSRLVDPATPWRSLADDTTYVGWGLLQPGNVVKDFFGQTVVRGRTEDVGATEFIE